MARLTLVALALTLGLSACGDSDSGAEGSAAGEAGSSGFDLASCLTAAGAEIARSPSDLAFTEGSGLGSGAEADSAGELADGSPTYSFKSSASPGWRIYVGAKPGQNIGFSQILDNPRAAEVVAHVNPEDPATVRGADDCLDGSVDDG